jgi:polyisoprenoid-binding protein YceI
VGVVASSRNPARTPAPAPTASWRGPERVSELWVDPSNARITFAARTCGILTVRGAFEEFGGVLRYADGDQRHSSLTATVRAASIRTGIALRDRHLRGWSYLDTAAHPTITFRSRTFEHAPPGVVVRGALTIRDITTEAAIACTSHPLPDSSAAGAARGHLLVGELTVLRSAFGIGRPSRRLGFLDVRPLLIGDEVRVRLEVCLPSL